MDTPRDISPDVIKIRDVVKGRNPVTRLTGEYTFEDLRTDGPMVCDWELRPETAGFSVHGDLHGTLELDCARCLETFPVPTSVEIQERYVFEHYVDPYGREKELQAEDFYEVADEEGSLDLKDLAHQFLILETANQSTCGRPECAFAQD